MKAGDILPQQAGFVGALILGPEAWIRIDYSVREVFKLSRLDPSWMRSTAKGNIMSVFKEIVK